jgi:septation ring formation regulator EzrA
VIATAPLASHPGPAMHLALLGVVVVIALVVFAVARIRRKRDATRIEELDQRTDTAQSNRERPPR